MVLLLGTGRVVWARDLEVRFRPGGKVGGDGTAGLFNKGFDGLGAAESQANVVVVIAAGVAVSGEVKGAVLPFNGLEVVVDARCFARTDDGLVKVKVDFDAGAGGGG